MEILGVGSSQVGVSWFGCSRFGSSGLEGRNFRVGFQNPSRLGLGGFGSESKLVLVVEGLFEVQVWFGCSGSGFRQSEVCLGVLGKVRSSFTVGSEVFRVGFDVQGWF